MAGLDWRLIGSEGRRERSLPAACRQLAGASVAFHGAGAFHWHPCFIGVAAQQTRRAAVRGRRGGTGHGRVSLSMPKKYQGLLQCLLQLQHGTAAGPAFRLSCAGHQQAAGCTALQDATQHTTAFFPALLPAPHLDLVLALAILAMWRRLRCLGRPSHITHTHIKQTNPSPQHGAGGRAAKK